MIRSQIDRLTPWAANDAVFSWSAPVEIAADRIHLTVVATPKAKVTPFVKLAEAWGVGSVALYASQDGESATADETKVFEKHMRGSLDVVRVRRILSIVLLVAAIAAALSFVVADVIGGGLESQQQQLSRRITERRALMRLSSGSSGDSAQTILARRKQNTPSSVLVLEALSEILPDNTYVTELRMEKDKLQIVGITQDAPSLVKMIEQSPHFTRATFFAPTTRSSNDPGERFHVEARLKPYFGPAT
jgi:general secretion pathway protein L